MKELVCPIHNERAGMSDPQWKSWYVQSTMKELVCPIHNERAGMSDLQWKSWYVRSTMKELVCPIYNERAGMSDLQWKSWYVRYPLNLSFSISQAALVHLNFWAGSIFPVPICTVSPGQTLNRNSRCNKVDAVRL